MFVSVGGKNAPDPQQSYLNPLTIPENPTNTTRDEGDRRFIIDLNPAFTLRHELGHYGGNGEWSADTQAYEGLKSGNYWVVFKNEKGITIS